jgi:hypothetical protein
MHKHIYKILFFSFAIFGLAQFVQAQTISPISPFRFSTPMPSITPVVSSSTLTLPYLGSAGLCVTTNASGTLGTGACGGSSGLSPWSTTSTFVYLTTSTNFVGIGTSTPDSTLEIKSTTRTGAGTFTSDGVGNITGTGTKFDTELNIGDTIYWNGTQTYGSVTSITNSTTMTVSSDNGDGPSTFFTYVKPVIKLFATTPDTSVFSVSDFPSLAFGRQTISSGLNSVALGSNNQATGIFSVAIGDGNRASKQGTVAIGNGNVVNGPYSTAFGNNVTVNGENSVGFGLGLAGSTVDQSNVMSIMGGNVGIGTSTPDASLHIESAASGKTFHLHKDFNWLTGDGAFTDVVMAEVKVVCLLTLMTQQTT